MNGKERAGVRKKLFLLPARAHLDGGKAARPIVAVQHLRRITQAAEQGNRRAAKKGKPLEIIYIAINLTAMEIVRRVNQIGRRTQNIAMPDANARTIPAPLDFEVLDQKVT